MGGLLVIAYQYPPLADVATIRNAKIVKYLSRNNWDIHVLTAKMEIIAGVDNSLMDSVPNDVKISAVDSYSRYVDKMETKGGFPALWWWLPDRRFLWINSSIRVGSRIIKENGIDLVYTLSPPYSATLIGTWLSKLHNLPHVIDFQDPWTQNFYLPEYPTRFHRWLNETLEHLVSDKSTRSRGLLQHIGKEAKDIHNLRHWYAIWC
jgi:hypothetical protein